MRGDLDRKATREEAEARALELLTKQRRPVLIGEVAVAIGHLWTLEDAEALLEQLARKGRVQKVPGSLIRYEMPKATV
jgi:hypothetical protein